MNKQQHFEQSEQIRTVIAYLNRFAKSSFVIHVDTRIFSYGRRKDDTSSTTHDGGISMQEFARDIAVLLQSGIKLVLVFSDAGPAHEKKIFSELPPSADKNYAVESSLQYCMEFFSCARHFGVNAVTGNWVSARAYDKAYDHAAAPPMHPEGKAYQIDRRQLNALFEQSCIPVFPDLGWNKMGLPYSLDSKDLALAIATQLHAEKLLFFTDAPLFAQFVRETSPTADRGNITLQELMAKKSSYSDTVEQLTEWIRHAIDQGIPRVHIVNGVLSGSILVETFSHGGSGCMVHSDAYEKIRPALPEDLANIEHIVRPLEELEYLRRRNRSELQAMIAYTVVHETDESIEACAALLPLSKKDAELAMLALAEGYEMAGIGRKMLRYLVQRAKKEGYRRIFAFTRRSIDWFYTQGFQATTLDQLTAERKKEYTDSESKSRILMMSV